jgi:NAD(P)H-hydrate epimerase
MAADLWQVLPEVVVQAPGFTAALMERLDAVLVGPGLGDPPQGLTAEAWQGLQRFPGLLVLDADAVTGLARAEGETWLRQRAGPTWLTPHRGEFARLFADLAERPAPEAALAASTRSGAAVLLKGARSVVAAADGRVWQLLQAWPEVARAGLGDVLAGYAAALGARARAAGCVDAAVLAAAALAHGLAGEAGGGPTKVAQRLPTIQASFDQKDTSLVGLNPGLCGFARQA